MPFGVVQHVQALTRGICMCSRNKLLTAENRQKALAIPAALQVLFEMCTTGCTFTL